MYMHICHHRIFAAKSTQLHQPLASLYAGPATKHPLIQKYHYWPIKEESGSVSKYSMPSKRTEGNSTSGLDEASNGRDSHYQKYKPSGSPSVSSMIPRKYTSLQQQYSSLRYNSPTQSAPYNSQSARTFSVGR